MPTDAYILGHSEIDLEPLLMAGNKALGRSLSQLLDQQGRDLSTPAAYLTVLATMKEHGADVTSTLEDPGHLLQHVFYTFLVICDPAIRIDLIQRTPLAIQDTPTKIGADLCVVSGDLESWRTAVINCCSDQSPFQTRQLFDKVLALFENEGLGKLWSGYAKKQMHDQTFKLIERK